MRQKSKVLTELSTTEIRNLMSEGLDYSEYKKGQNDMREALLTDVKEAQRGIKEGRKRSYWLGVLAELERC